MVFKFEFSMDDEPTFDALTKGHEAFSWKTAVLTLDPEERIFVGTVNTYPVDDESQLQFEWRKAA